MNQTTKSLLIGLVCFVFGAGAVYIYITINDLKRTNETLTTQQQTEPTTTILPSETIFPIQSTVPETATTKPIAQAGTITGTIGYPSEGVPPMSVYAFLQSDLTKYVTINTTQNQPSFTLSNVPAGTYVVVAYLQDSADQAGGYSKAVACGLSVDCKDHSLVPVIVTAGQTSQGVEVKDWYVSPGTFPAKPK